MEPLSLATAVVSLLISFFKQAAGKLAERTGESVADAAIPKLRMLYQRVRAKLPPASHERALLDELQAEPGNAERREALRVGLAELLARDPQFTSELRHLLAQVQDANAAWVAGTDAGVVAGRDVHLRGQHVAGRDMTIGNSSPPPQPQ